MPLSENKYLVGVTEDIGIYMAHGGGFFFQDSIPKELIAHEMFHSFYTHNLQCGNLWIDEGLTTFMQKYAFYKIGIYSKEEFEEKFDENLAKLTNISKKLERYNISTPDLKNKEKLREFRKKNPELYHLFVYELGTQVWKEVYDSFESEEDFISLLNKSLVKKDCQALEEQLKRNHKI
jgi:hypothetical protein